MGDWVYLGAHSRIGTYKVVGPVTGVFYHIPIAGTWVDEEDAAVLKETMVSIYCFRQEKMIDIHPVFELSISQDTLAGKPPPRNTT